MNEFHPLSISSNKIAYIVDDRFIEWLCSSIFPLRVSSLWSQHFRYTRLVRASLRSMYFYPCTIISGLANEVMKVWVIWGNNCIQNDKFLKIWQVSSTAVSYPLYPNLHFKLGTLSTVKQKSSWMYFCFAYVRDKSYYQTAVDKGYGQATMTHIYK